MAAMDQSLVLGIDGGGTKTVCWLAPLADDSTGTVVGRGTSGPGNPRAAGFETAQANIDAAIAAAFADAKLPRTIVAAACLSLAGAGRASEQERITKWAESRALATKIIVTDDAEPILAVAGDRENSIALIAGTGSLCVGRTADGRRARAGGWGYLLGDEGIGYAIGLAALRAAVRAADGRGTATDMLGVLVKRLDAKTPQQLVERVYSPDMTRERIAALADVPFDLATTDAVAGQIVDQAVNDLVDMVASVAEQLSLAPQQFTLTQAGGAMLNLLNFSERVFYAILARGVRPGHWLVVHEPVEGAVAIARGLK
jgi:N-acetylglucosamine kinase-like BadF-type ATPase